MEAITLSLGGEGGGVTILGRRKSDGSGWEFAMKRASDTWLLFEDGAEQNPDYRPPPLEWEGSWSEAIGLIERFPWAILVPTEVHPEFRAEVLVEATHRLTSDHPKYAFTPASTKNRAMERFLEMCR